MAEPKIELLKLTSEVAKATSAFMEVVNREINKKTTNNEVFDVTRLINELKFCTPEGIDLNIAIEKRDKFKADNGIS